MNSRITLAVFMTLGTLMTFSINPLQQQIQQNAFAQDDESDTDTEQRLRQKNLGSGESTNFNCAENMITSASDSIECIPSGPTPPTPPTVAFTISGIGSGTVTCTEDTNPAIIEISAQGDTEGTVTGAFGIGIQGSGTFVFTVTGGTTDGNTFSLTGETSPGIFCGDEVQRFTISGDCGIGVEIRYEEPDVSSTFTGNVQCVLT